MNGGMSRHGLETHTLAVTNAMATSKDAVDAEGDRVLNRDDDTQEWLAPADRSKLVALAQYRAEDDADVERVTAMAARARSFLSSFAWCDEVPDVLVGNVTVADVVTVFLCRITSTDPAVDPAVWVVVGDVPPAYLAVGADTQSPAAALDAYVGEMERWVAAAKEDVAADDLIPVLSADGSVEIAPTPENAVQLERRLQLIDSEVLSGFHDDLA